MADCVCGIIYCYSLYYCLLFSILLLLWLDYSLMSVVDDIVDVYWWPLTGIDVRADDIIHYCLLKLLKWPCLTWYFDDLCEVLIHILNALYSDFNLIFNDYYCCRLLKWLFSMTMMSVFILCDWLLTNLLIIKWLRSMTYIDWYSSGWAGSVLLMILLHSMKNYCYVQYVVDVILVMYCCCYSHCWWWHYIVVLHCSHCCYCTFWWWFDTWYRIILLIHFIVDEYCCVWYSFWWPMMTIDLMMTVFLMICISDVMIYIDVYYYCDDDIDFVLPLFCSILMMFFNIYFIVFHCYWHCCVYLTVFYCDLVLSILWWYYYY
jgi:hypothetical protein